MYNTIREYRTREGLPMTVQTLLQYVLAGMVIVVALLGLQGVLGIAESIIILVLLGLLETVIR